jgi:hypothetical protein
VASSRAPSGADGLKLLKLPVQDRTFQLIARDEMGTVQPETEAHLGALVISILEQEGFKCNDEVNKGISEVLTASAGLVLCNVMGGQGSVGRGTIAGWRRGVVA